MTTAFLLTIKYPDPGFISLKVNATQDLSLQQFIQRCQYIQSRVSPINYRIVMQIDARTLKDCNLTIDRKMVHKFPNNEHGQHRGTRDAFLDRSGRKLADSNPLLLFAHILTTYIALHV